jgi:hypothetical protein
MVSSLDEFPLGPPLSPPEFFKDQFNLKKKVRINFGIRIKLQNLSREIPLFITHQKYQNERRAWLSWTF